MKNSVKQAFANHLSDKKNQNKVSELEKVLEMESDETVSQVLEELWNEYKVEPLAFLNEQASMKILIDKQCKTQEKKTFKFRLNSWMYIAAAVIFLVTIGITGMQLFNHAKTPDYASNNVVVTTKSGEKATITLPDGSIVKLNAASTLSYPENFSGECRNVNLEGEAYFDVQKMNGKKFIVNTKTHAIEVLGTSFNVMSYTQDQMVEIVLLTGRVKAHKTHGNTCEVMLEPNEKYAYNAKLNEITVTQTNADFETAWMRNELVFRNETFKNVICKLERFYGVNISSSRIESIENETFNGRFENNNIQKVLEILAVHYPIKYKIEKNNIAIYVKK
jgi:transmembrane sensor